jgi:hypothetical protein
VGYHPRIETSEMPSFVTSRSRNAELWFVNNASLEEKILAYAAKYCERREVKLYALAIEGSHIQAPADFPRMNRADFMRDLNSSVARAIPRLCPEYPGGRFWGRRYSNEFLPGPEDTEAYFFYTVLQPVNDGLVERLSDYPGYNCFHDAVHGIERQFEFLDIKRFNTARRRNPGALQKDYTTLVTLKYHRLPGYEELTQEEYAAVMYQKREDRRVEIVNKHKADGKSFLGRERLRSTRPGTRPKNPKTSKITDHRPRILSVCPKRRSRYKSWYFSIYFAYKEASKCYRAGQLDVEFPEGTYRPRCTHHDPPSYS